MKSAVCTNQGAKLHNFSQKGVTFAFHHVLKSHKEVNIMSKIAIFASGNGSNAEAIIKYFQAEDRGAEVALVVCNHPDVAVIGRSFRLGVPCVVVNRSVFNNPEVMLPMLDNAGIELIVLAGFMLMIPDFMLRAYDRRIINIHPSLLPKYGGKGMYGHHVHEAVVAAGEIETGITIHYVSEVCDGGDIIYQATTNVHPGDTAEDVEAKVHTLEYIHFAPVIHDLVKKLNK